MRSGWVQGGWGRGILKETTVEEAFQGQVGTWHKESLMNLHG